jgi:hypothetical protein
MTVQNMTGVIPRAPERFPESGKTMTRAGRGVRSTQTLFARSHKKPGQRLDGCGRSATVRVDGELSKAMEQCLLEQGHGDHLPAAAAVPMANATRRRLAQRQPCRQYEQQEGAASPHAHRAAAAGRAWPPSPDGGRWEASLTELTTSRQRSTAAGAGRRVRIRVTPGASKKEEKEALKREELPALPALPALLHFRAVAGSCQPTFDNYPHYPQRG